ncbi:MAG TPA: C39 family peptidase [Candidatus Woesebacteria bacterium]|nr:C39 family peptidase [Candidatus Woesebacteria bacterium]
MKLKIGIILLLVLISAYLGTKIFQKPTVQTKIEQIKQEIVPTKPIHLDSTGLPNRYLIEAPFVEQAPKKDWSQPWQDACEEAALLTPYYYYSSITPSSDQIVQDLTKIFDYENSQGWSHDVNLEQMQQIAQDLWGLSSEIIQNPTVDQIKERITNNQPIVVPANGKTLFKENKHFKAGGPWYHNLVIIGFDDDQKKFIVHDVGTQFGANFKYSYSLLLKSIHDFPTTLNKEDIDQGDQKVLVLLK